jgi:hypothetical protein
MKRAPLAFFVLLALFPSAASAQDCVPPSGGKCLSADQFGSVKSALEELDGIKKAEMTGEVLDPVVIVHDWDERVYVNGGDGKPIRMRVRVGTVDRTLAVKLPTTVYYREKPADPMFRLRFRAQVGVLPVELYRTATGTKQQFWDAGFGLDFFHVGLVNLSLNVGAASSGLGLGFDLTKNFGLTVGYAAVYDGLRSGAFAGAYFSFN